MEFEDAGDAKEAINNMDQSELYGRVIRVAMAKPDSKRDLAGPGAGSLVAVWEQEGYLSGRKGEDGEGVSAELAGGEDSMTGLEGLDVAGPRVA